MQREMQACLELLPKTEASFVEPIECLSVSLTLGTRTAYRRADDEANGPEARLAVPDGIDPEAGSAYQPRWAVRALTSCNCREDT